MMNKNTDSTLKFGGIRYEYSLDYVFLLSYTKLINFPPLCVAA